jgi:hypothetical protein
MNELDILLSEMLELLYYKILIDDFVAQIILHLLYRLCIKPQNILDNMFECSFFFCTKESRGPKHACTLFSLFSII